MSMSERKKGNREGKETRDKLLTVFGKPRTKEHELHVARHLLVWDTGSRHTTPSSQSWHGTILRFTIEYSHDECVHLLQPQLSSMSGNGGLL